MPVENKPYSDEQKRAFAEDKALLKSMQNEETYVKAVVRFTDAITDAESEGIQELQGIVAANLEESVTDPELREKLRPVFDVNYLDRVGDWARLFTKYGSSTSTIQILPATQAPEPMDCTSPPSTTITARPLFEVGYISESPRTIRDVAAPSRISFIG